MSILTDPTIDVDYTSVVHLIDCDHNIYLCTCKRLHPLLSTGF